jgi:hypothetical protein
MRALVPDFVDRRAGHCGVVKSRWLATVNTPSRMRTLSSRSGNNQLRTVACDPCRTSSIAPASCFTLRPDQVANGDPSRTPFLHGSNTPYSLAHAIFRELSERGVWHCTAGEPVTTAAVWSREIRRSRAPEQRARLGEAFMNDCVEALGLDPVLARRASLPPRY